MNRVQAVLTLTITAINANDRDATKDTIAFDEIVRNLLDNFDHNKANEAAFVVSVAIICLHSRHSNSGFPPLRARHYKMTHFTEFHNRYGDRIIGNLDDEITEAIDFALDYGYHTILTSYWMDESLINLQLAA